MNPSWSARPDQQPYATGWNGNNMGGPTANNLYGIGGSGPILGSPGRPQPQGGPCFGHNHGPMPYGPGTYGISNGPGPVGSQSPRMHSPYHNQQPPAVGYQAQYTAIRIPPGTSSTPPMLRSDSSGNEDSYQGRFDTGGQSNPEIGYAASFEGAAAANTFPAAGTSSISGPSVKPVIVGPTVQDQHGVIPLPKTYKTYYSHSVPPPIAHKPAFPLLVPPPRPSNMLGPAG